METIVELRQQAARARHHGLILIFDEAGQRLLALARELDARADAMEITMQLTTASALVLRFES
jgi:hypothetical protein